VIILAFVLIGIFSYVTLIGTADKARQYQTVTAEATG
jgi:hypothetical protein